MFILILETKCFVTEKNLTHRLGPMKAEDKMRQVIIFLFLCVFVTCDGLKCFCNEIVGCDGNICLTDGTCRTWIKKMGDSGVKHGYQCLDKNKLFPPERPFACENSAAVQHRYLQQCCDHQDGCNKNISLAFADDDLTTSDEGVGTTASVNDKKTIYLVITILACSVMILTTGCCIYIIRLSRARTRAAGNGTSWCTMCPLPCWSQYTEVDSKCCDAVSTTTIQVWIKISKM